MSLLVVALLMSAEPPEPSLTSWGAGAMLVQSPAEYSAGWSAWQVLDELPKTGWASPKGDVSPKTFVIELADRAELHSVELDTGRVDGPGGKRAARDVLLELSDQATDGYTEAAKLTLEKAKDKQRFELKPPKQGRYLRVTVQSNHGATDYLELMELRAYGKPLEQRPLPNHTGAFKTRFGTFRIKQTGVRVDGCYEHDDGRIENGGFDGRTLRFTWSEAAGKGKPRDRGTAVMIFADDSQSFAGFWWNKSGGGKPAGTWFGTRASQEPGDCPAASLEEQLSTDGRVRLYGINFDVDSDKLREESKGQLDAVVATAKAQPKWAFTIEGHTDSTASAAHNQALSQARADAVKKYLVAAGVAAERLSCAGLGSTVPVADNETSAGRAQNRRVEIVKKSTP